MSDTPTDPKNENATPPAAAKDDASAKDAGKKPGLWDEIRRATDELEQTIAQAGAEARQKWTELKPRLKEIEQKMDAKTAEASAWVAEEMGNVGAEVRRLRDDVVNRFKKKP